MSGFLRRCHLPLAVNTCPVETFGARQQDEHIVKQIRGNRYATQFHIKVSFATASRLGGVISSLCFCATSLGA